MNLTSNSCGINISQSEVKSIWEDSKRTYKIPENVYCVPHIPCSTCIQIISKGTISDEMYISLRDIHKKNKSGETHSIEDFLNFDEWKVIQISPKIVIDVKTNIIAKEPSKLKNIDRTVIE